MLNTSASIRRSVLVLLTGFALFWAPPLNADAASRGKLDSTLRQRAERPQGRIQVIVRLRSGADGAAVVRRASGAARSRLGLLNAQVAELSDASLEALAADPDVLSVHYDRPLVASADGAPVRSVSGASGQASLGGYDGSGVGVAVIDSGIAAHGDLLAASGRSRVAAEVDFVGSASGVSDDYGHGTHVAGIIAGSGAGSRGAYAGMAPGAHLVSLKVLDAEGRGTISNAIRAIEYAVANRRRFNLRVINLSVGAAVTESYNTDPLTLAAKKAVDAGLVVVAAAGNLGKNAQDEVQFGGITAPGNSPWVLTVGAYTTMGTPMLDDDRVAGYSSRGPTAVDYLAKPDVVAPGTRIISLAAPDSTLALARPEDLLPGSAASARLPYFILSGTSMAAPAVSGTVALMLQANPSLTPNAVKAVLQYTARFDDDASALAQGAGFLNDAGAVTLASFFVTAKEGDAYPLESAWSQHLLWGNYLVSGGVLRPDGTAFATNIVWGSAIGDNIVWGSGGDNIVWGSGLPDNIVWGS